MLDQPNRRCTKLHDMMVCCVGRVYIAVGVGADVGLYAGHSFELRSDKGRGEVHALRLQLSIGCPKTCVACKQQWRARYFILSRLEHRPSSRPLGGHAPAQKSVL
eukprot:6794830-Alexandrium_andersonii.AAC.1